MRVPTAGTFQQQENLISDQYDKLNRLYIQQTTGKKLISPSDDPVLASRIQLTTNYLSNINTYGQNEIIASNRMQLYSSSVSDAVSILGDVKTIIQNAGNDTLSDSNRSVLAEQLKGDLNRLLSVANTQDGNGDFIYSGYNTSMQPYVKNGANYSYQGGYSSTSINIGQNVNTLYGESGYDVFGNIPNGNGTFTVTMPTPNLGTVSTTAGNISNTSSYVEDTYTLTFVTNSAGNMAYQVVGASSGQVVPAPPLTIPNDAPDYKSGLDINFNGISMNLSGDPVVGDSFEIAPSKKQNVFDTINDLINLLQTPIDNDPVKRASFHQSLSQSRASIDQAFAHMIDYQSEVGTRMSVVNDQTKLNKSIALEQETILSQLSEVDPVKVISSIQQQLIILQATQSTYVQIQNMILSMLSGG